MKDIRNKSLVLLLLFVLAACMGLAGCGSGQSDAGEEQKAAAASEEAPAAEEAPVLKGCAISHEERFGGINILIGIEEFGELGFAFGDSMDITFSNGYTMEDIPYYNGYYTDPGRPLLIGYPGSESICLKINYGDDLWDQAGVTEADTAAVSLAAAGAYKDVQEAMDLQYSNDRDEFSSDEVFANFRSVSCSGIRPDTVYRSASPADNSNGRAAITDRLCKEKGIAFILDLADSEEDIEGYIEAEDFDSPHFLPLYRGGKVIPLDMNANYKSEEFAALIAKGLTEMSKAEGPYLIHCTEGKDRTGFVCALVEALAGAEYREIVDDYMITYDNYYGISEEADAARYQTIKEKNIDAMLVYLAGCEAKDLPEADLAAGAEKYLTGAGMNEQDIHALLERIQ